MHFAWARGQCSSAERMRMGWLPLLGAGSVQELNTSFIEGRVNGERWRMHE
jgi:hypothetical protein